MRSPNNLRFPLYLFLLVALLMPFGLFAQSSNGAISGTIKDGSGAALPGVTVMATSEATAIVRTAVTNERGSYQVGLLPAGTYGVVADLSGFQPTRRDRVVVNVGTVSTLDFTLKVGVSESVTVTSAAPVVETTRTQVSSVVNEKAIQNLPTNGRNFLDFALTTPGVVRDTRLGDISFAGQRGTLNSLVIDGANNDNTFFGQALGRTGSGRAPYQFSQDAVKEFQVNTNSYSAEYGRAGGAVINVVTKSGSNEFHGTAFDFYRDRRLNANDYINQINARAKSPYHFDQYGASVGGPIVRDKHFFFANVDFQRNSVPNLVVLGGGRTVAIPADAASQAGLAKLQALDDDYSRQQNQDVFLLKTDHELLKNNHLSLRYNRQTFHGINFENGGITNSSQHTGNSNVFTDTFSGVLATTATGSFFNEVRGQYAKDSEPGTANSSDPESQIFQGGILLLTIGRNSFSPRETTIKRNQLADTATFLLGNHTFKGGFDVSRDRILNYFPGNFFGLYRFDSLADYANGKPALFTQAFAGVGTSGPITHPDITETGIFLQDEWHVSSNLTANIGVRYDREKIAQPSVLNSDPQLLAAGIRTDRIREDKNDIGPRLGLAWTPGSSNRTVIRAGYGIFYGRTPAIMIGTAHSNNGINVQTIAFDPTKGNPVPLFPNVFSTIPAGATIAKPTILVFDPNFQNPKVTQSSLGVEQQVGNDFSVGLTYQFVKGTRLQRSADINVSDPTTVTNGICQAGKTAAQCAADPTLVQGNVSYKVYNGRPFANFSRIIQFQSSAKSRYNGLTLDLNKRLSNNWQARLAYTFSNVSDNRPDATAVVPGSDDAKFVSDPLDFGTDYSSGDADVRHRVVLSGVWSLDSYAEHVSGAFGHALLSGWTFSGIASYQSGQPYSAVVNADLNNDGNRSNDLAPGLRRNALRYPAQFDVSPRIARDIPLVGSARLQLIAEAFNLLNKSNVNGYSRTYYSLITAANGTRFLQPQTSFNTASLSAGPRIVQLAAKVIF